VWGVIVFALYLAWFINPGFGLIAVYLTLVNAVVHVVAAGVLRLYNPGLVTAILLFLPLSVYSLFVFQQSSSGGIGFQALGIAIAVLIHAAIVGYAKTRI
jgi:hypothetical protein